MIRGGRSRWPSHLRVFRSFRGNGLRRLTAQQLRPPRGTGYLQAEIE